MTLFVKKINTEQLKENWKLSTKEAFRFFVQELSEGGLYIESSQEGDVNWSVSSVFSGKELIETPAHIKVV